MRAKTPTSPIGRRLTSESGLTLIELAVVLAIIGALSAVALPRVAMTLDQGRLQYSARRVIGAIRLARSEAVTSGQPRKLVFHRSRGAIDLVHTDRPMKTIRIEEPTRIEAVSVRRKDRVKGAPRLLFQPDGRVTEAAIYLRDEASQLTLHVEPLTGRVEVFDGLVRYDFTR